MQIVFQLKMNNRSAVAPTVTFIESKDSFGLRYYFCNSFYAAHTIAIANATIKIKMKGYSCVNS